MINKRPTRNYATLKSIIILPVAAILFVMFSFKPESISKNNGPQEPLFSQKSQSKILEFLGMNTGYPQEAKSSADTGKIFVVVKMGKGGIVKECKAYTEKAGIKVPFLPEVVIVGYQTPGPGDIRPGKVTGNVHLELQAESERVVNKLGSVNIPEWKEKDMEFALTLNFVLK